MADVATERLRVTPAPQAVQDTFQSQSSFAQKLINVQFQLAQNTPGNTQPSTFSGTGSSTVNLIGHRTRARISNAGAPSGSMLDLSIYGLTPDLINQLTQLGVVGNVVSKNNVIVSAGTVQGGGDASAIAAATVQPPQGLPIVFAGTIWQAFGDYKNMPDVALRVTAQTGLFNAVQPVAPSSFHGDTSIVSIMQGFAKALGVPLENNGVSGSLSNPYFPGTLLEQIYQAADHAHIVAQLVDGATKLAIWPIGGSRTSVTNIPLISKSTGMIRSPSFGQNGWLIVETLFNPDVLFGGNIRVQSDVVPQANKTWTVYKLDLALDSLVPNGEWMTTAFCYPANMPAGVPPPGNS